MFEISHLQGRENDQAVADKCGEDDGNQSAGCGGIAVGEINDGGDVEEPVGDSDEK